MNKYKVTGADKESGNERCEIVFAKNPQRAEHSARLRGMYVSSIERLPDNLEVTTSTWRQVTANKLEPVGTVKTVSSMTALQLFMIVVGAILTAALIPTFLILLLKALSAVAHP